MDQHSPLLTVVMPYYNEEENIDPVVDQTVAGLEEAFGNRYEIILVNDGSSDNSDRIGMNCTNRHKRVRLYRHDKNRGLGAAIKTGYLASAGEYLSFLPCDGEVEVDQIIKLWNANQENDMVISRRDRDVPFYREILTACWWFIMKMLFGFDVRSEGIYIIRRDVLESIGLYHMHSTTGLLNIEIAMRAVQAGCSYQEELIDTKPRLSGESKVANIGTTATTLWETFKLRITPAPAHTQTTSEPRREVA